jgi:hypothetical protein
VVRYLTVQHNVPLRRISVLGVGEAPDVEENTRAARKDSRRVDVRIFALDLKGGMPAQQQSNLQSSNTPSSNQ